MGAKAPFPSHINSLLGVTCQAVDAVKGGARMADVRKLWPAAQGDSKHSCPSPDRLHKTLLNAVYRGYLVVDRQGTTDRKKWRYHRAPLGYYQERVAVMKRKQAESEARVAARNKPESIGPLPYNHEKPGWGSRILPPGRQFWAGFASGSLFAVIVIGLGALL